MFSNLKKIAPLWYNMESNGKARQATDDNIICRTCIACSITKSTDARSKYVTLIALPQHQRALERVNVTFYVHCLSCFFFFILSYNCLWLIHLSPHCNINIFSQYFNSFQIIWQKVMITLLSFLVYVISGTTILNDTLLRCWKWMWTWESLYFLPSGVRYSCICFF